MILTNSMSSIEKKHSKFIRILIKCSVEVYCFKCLQMLYNVNKLLFDQSDKTFNALFNFIQLFEILNNYSVTYH